MHWRNSHLQIKNFIAGSCHTADEMYRKLCELREERDVAINNVKVSEKRSEAKAAKAQYTLNSDSPQWDKLEAEADLEEIEVFKEQSASCYQAAINERDYIDDLIERVKPFRKYAHLPDHEAHQAVQEEEWKLELIFRAENFLSSQGHIPSDHLSIMRMHPAFQLEILPRVQEIAELINGHKNAAMILSNPGSTEEDKSFAMRFIEEAPEPVLSKSLPFLEG